MSALDELRALQDLCERADALRAEVYGRRNAAVLAARESMTQRAVARELGVTHGAVQDIERRAGRAAG